jgi:hypothetical protein
MVGCFLFFTGVNMIKYVKIQPFKTITVEYFEEFVKDDSKVVPDWQGPGQRRIRVVTTTRDYNSGSVKGEPNISVNYHYL